MPKIANVLCDRIKIASDRKKFIENHFDHSFELENNLLAKGKRQTLASAQEMLKIPGSYAYVRQQEPAGLGHAIWCARHLIQNESFAVILADDLIFGQSTAIVRYLSSCSSVSKNRNVLSESVS